MQKKFGTFLGVYTPSILTILGLIMYLRFGWVVGNLGLGLTILTVVMASSITFITGLSASAIATNLKVGVGGEYFLVSRSLGLEFGGAIGIPLYLCRTLSVTFYCFGFAEAILLLWPEQWGTVPSYGIQLGAAIMIVLVTLLSGKSAALTLKAQIPIMILVGLSIVALMIGVFSNGIRAPEWNASYRTANEGFWYVFAVFFPAVTGFTAGIGMSGDLKDPAKSIPRGTLGAVVSGVAVYLLIPILLSITLLLTFEQLADPTAGVSTWTRIAFLGGILVYPAVWGAILSSAFGSILGGPRVLQALSMDGLAPKFLSKLSKTGQPTVATWISGVLALVAVSLGELNTVAQFVSVLFLTLYVAINASAAVEQLVSEPSYRPQIRVPWYVSLLGAAGAIGVMYLISPIACIAALILEILIYTWLRSRSLEQRWGDVTTGFWLNLSRFSLLNLDQRQFHPRNWRPLMLVFVSDINHRLSLVRLAEALGQNQGILTIIRMLVKGRDDCSVERMNEVEAEMRGKLETQGMRAFCEAHRVDDVQSGILEISKSHGLGHLRTNTVVFGWSEDKMGQIGQLGIIKELADNEKNILLVRFHKDFDDNYNDIDLWWGGRENNGDLMLLLSHLLKLNVQWSKSNITIRSLVRSQEEKAKLENGIQAILPRARIKTNVDVIVSDAPFRQVVHERSRNASIIFFGLPEISDSSVERVAENIDLLSKDLNISVFVQNNGMTQSVPILLQVGDIST